MDRRPLLHALLAGLGIHLLQLAQRVAGIPLSPSCYYAYATLAIAACSAIAQWGAKVTVPIDALLPPGT